MKILFRIVPVLLALAGTAQAQVVLRGVVVSGPQTYTIGGDSPLTLTATGALRVDGSGVIQPVSGTVGLTGTLPAFAATPTFNCGTGCSSTGGTFNNNADGLATTATNGQAASWNYGWNGTGWDRLQVNASKALKVDASATTQPVSGTFWQATQPVSGTFWQATQPVSIASMPSTPVTGTFWQATQPVSGTFWQATQPVSLTTLPSLAAGSAIAGKFGVDQTTPGTTNGVSLAQIGATAVSTGAGATGAGAQRVGVAQDTTTIAGAAPGTAGSPSPNVLSMQGVSGGVALPTTLQVGAAGLATNQISVATTSTLIVAARTGAPGTGRVAVTILNSGAATVFYGVSGLTTANGSILPAGAAVTLNTTAAVYGIVATGTVTVSYTETF